MPEPSHNDHPSDRSRYSRWAFWGFLLIAGYFLITEHRAHLYGWVSSYGIWLLLLACPLLHMFHSHGGHGRRAGHGNDDKEGNKDLPS